MTNERTSPSAQRFAELLGEGPIAKVALEACLSQLDGAAFIVSARGTVLHANVEGKRRLKSSPGAGTEVKDAVSAHTSSDRSSNALVTPIRVAQAPPYYLVLFRPPSSFEQRLAQAAKLWSLTPRQREVFRLVAEGFSNKTIASELTCTERTVEAHVTAILEKSGLVSRTALVASVAR